MLNLVGETFSFGAVQHLVDDIFGGFGVAIGFFERDHLTLSPAPGTGILWTEDHRIVAIVRSPGNSSRSNGGNGGGGGGGSSAAAAPEEEKLMYNNINIGKVGSHI